MPRYLKKKKLILILKDILHFISEPHKEKEKSEFLASLLR